MSEFEMETIRPTNTMIKDVFGGVASETWGFRNCAVAKMHDGSICGVIFRRFTDGPYKGEIYYGFIRYMFPRTKNWQDQLDISCSRLENCPDIFTIGMDWENVTEGNRYVYP